LIYAQAGFMMNEITICSNIGRGQRRLRYLGALACASIAIVATILLIVTGASRWWRLLIAPIIWFGSYSYLEAVYRTCAALAARDEQSLEDELVLTRTLRGDKIQDDNLKRMLRETARKIKQQVIMITTATMIAVLLIP
jgi:hypothetical protein